VYTSTLSNSFVFDDIPIVLENSNIRGLSKMPEILSSGYGEGTQLGFTALYRPLIILSLAANYQAGGLSPWHYHLVNTLLHAANALLVVLLTFRLTRNSFIAGAAGFIFALHPVNTEAVAPVVGRTDLLCAFFVLCSLLLYAKAAKGEKHRPLLLTGSLACLAGGLLSKEHAVTAVGFVLLWDLVARDRSFREFFRNLPRRLLYPYSAFIGVVVAYIVVRYAVVGRVGVGGTISVLDNPLIVLKQPAQFFTAGKVTLTYLFRLIAPVTLAHDYSYPQILPATAAESVAALFVLAVIAWALVYSYRKNRPAFFGMAFFAIGFSIVSNLVFLIGTIMAERLLYLPGIGFAIAVAALLEAGRRYAADKKNARLATVSATALLAVICVLFGIRTILRTFDWRSEYTLYEQAVRVVPNNAKVRMTRGQTLRERGEYDRALEEFAESLRLLGPNVGKWFRIFPAHIHFEMANIHKKQNRYGPALAGYQNALRLHPRFARAHRNLAYLYGAMPGETEKAIPHLEHSLELDPNQPDADKLKDVLRQYYGGLRPRKE
jgi:tetratricopeptide (TPR) repeat protein